MQQDRKGKKVRLDLKVGADDIVIELGDTKMDHSELKTKLT